MVNSEHLTYRDCPYYTRISAGDEAFSRCCISGGFCDADEAGLECDTWNEEKLAMYIEEEVQRQFANYHHGMGCST